MRKDTDGEVEEEGTAEGEAMRSAIRVMQERPLICTSCFFFFS